MFKRYAFAAAAAVALLFPAGLLAQVSVAERLAPGQPPVIAAQRALGGGFPENALAGIQYALDRGLDMVKIDIQLTRDGQYVVMHDWTLNRTTDVTEIYPDGAPQGPDRAASGGKDFVRNYTLDEIRRLRLTDGPEGGDHKVPTLAEALDLVDGRMLVAIGLKLYEVDSLTAFLEKRDTRNLLFFDIYYADARLMHEVIAATGIRALVSMSASKTYLADLEKLADGLGANLAAVVVKRKPLTPDVVARAADLGVGLFLSGLTGGEDSALTYRDDPAPWQTTLATDATGFLTAHPDAVMTLLGR